MSTLNDNEFHAESLRGGASRHYESGNVPDRGYMVGSVPNAEGISYPEISRPVDAFDLTDVRSHARAIRDHFGTGSHGLHQGAWVENDKVVLDASDRHDDRVTAMTAGAARNERAIYDINRDRDIDIDAMKRKVRN